MLYCDEALALARRGKSVRLGSWPSTDYVRTMTFFAPPTGPVILTADLEAVPFVPTSDELISPNWEVA